MHRTGVRGGTAPRPDSEAQARGSSGPGSAQDAGSVLADHFGIPSRGLPLEAAGPLSVERGYFTFGGVMCYGRCSGHVPSGTVDGNVPEVGPASMSGDGRLRLPFDLDEIVTNLRQERYRQAPPRLLGRLTAARLSTHLYYLVRPLLPVAIRKHLQRIRLRGWDQVPFPAWPVDSSVEDLLQEVLRAALQHRAAVSIPFVWFWPDGRRSCAMMTHDVEGPTGRDFCRALMDVDDEFGVPAAFQIVPDAACGAMSLLHELRRRGFEVNVHDLSHDGSLFKDHRVFASKAALINSYARMFGARGFRSGAMYREQSWFGAFDFSYDMSVPNVAHLEPQGGGCCTTFPYFVGDILELPLTTTQDYSLFNILGDYSTTLWRRQIARIVETHGLISFIAHPDYLADRRALDVYRELLGLLSELRDAGAIWLAAPGDIDRWWRARRKMTLVEENGDWRVEGPGSARARVAFATLENGRVAYTVAESTGRDFARRSTVQ